jgi:hypothetical protein
VSDIGAILDRIQTDADAAVAGLVSERGVRLAEKLKDEDLPHLFIYNPEETIELLPLQVEQQELRVQLRLVTEDETQEQTATKMDAIRDAIRSDRTLNGLVTYSYVANRGIVEQEDSSAKFGEMLVIAVTTGGSVFTYTISVELLLTPGISVSTFAGALKAFLTNPGSPLAGFSALGSDYVLNRDAVGVAGSKLQTRVIPIGYAFEDSNLRYQRVFVQVLVYQHLRETDTEQDYTEDAMAPALTTLMDPAWWRSISNVYDAEPPSVTPDGDVGREV